ncbi:hypothetical protein J437_LFUL012371 [Ladona fulva]|uniref:Pre-rRNA-processing protein RIX1 N-terminal domain-containing protein n=1 Tax=Ladona fulva TaxID=123851 RepID=A0A8K0P465_LADFU|nr:hypothetical protein J437_LFUL012371 [Ladona fulva]
MEGLTHLFHTVLQSPHRNSCLGDLLLDCAEHQAFSTIDSSELQSVVAQINSNLNEHNNRFCGILILKTFLSQCPDEIFSSNAFSWVSQLMRAINDKTELAVDSENELSFLVLRDIIVASSQFPDVSKQLLPLIPKLLTILTSGITKDCEESLLCLQSCMKYYSSQCFSFKAAICKLLLDELTSECESLVEVAAECFALLPLLGGSSGIKRVSIINGINANYSGEWNQLLSKVIRTLHIILNSFFAGVNEVKGYSEMEDVLPLPSESDDFSVVMKQNVVRKFTNLSRYLCLMLQNPLPAAKIIPVEEVMGLLCRALAVTCNSLKDKVSSEFLALGARLPEIHSASFSILSVLMAWMHLLPYGSLIVKLVMQSLKWTSTSKDWPSSIRKPYSTLRCSAYHCISMWLHVSAAASCAEDVAEELINCALIDMVPTREKLKLVSSNIGNKHLGKQKRRKMGVFDLHTDENTPSSFLSGMRCAVGDGSANSEICCAALEMLSSLLQSVGLFLKPNLHKILQDTTILILIDIQRSTGTISTKQSNNRDILASMIVPYQSDAKCYLALLKLMLALVLEPHSHKWPSPLGLAVQIFSTGQNDSNIEVATFCATAKRVVERLIHPVAPTLNFPVSLPESQDMSISEENSEFISTEVSNQTKVSVCSAVGTQTDEVLQKGTEARESTDFRILGNGNHESTETSDLIVLSDDDSKLSRHSVATSPNDFSKSRIPSPDVLFIRTGLADGKLKGEKNVMLPFTYLKSKGVQCTGSPLLDDRGDTSANSPPLLVVKVPIDKCSTDKMVDFSQQFPYKPMEDVVPIEVNSDDEDEPVEMEMNHVDDCSELEVTAKLGTAAPGGENGDSGEVMVVDVEPPKAENLHSNSSSVKSPTGKKIIETCKENAAEVEIVELDDTSNTPVTKNKVVELDEEIAELEDKLNSFVDVSSEDD